MARITQSIYLNENAQRLLCYHQNADKPVPPKVTGRGFLRQVLRLPVGGL